MTKDLLLDAQAAYDFGRLSEALELLGTCGPADSRHALLEATILFDVGSAELALAHLDELCQRTDVAVELQYQIEFARFSRSAPFYPPQRTATLLARVRQLATTLGKPQTIAGLHVAVAKLETLCGSTDDAHRHLEIARRIASASTLPDIAQSVSLLEASVNTGTGNLTRAMQANASAIDTARRRGVAMPLAGLIANAGQLALWNGQHVIARRFLLESLGLATEFRFLQLGILDSLAALETFEGNFPEAEARIKACQAVIATHRVPARSWYDLTHQLTRCLFHSLREEWEAIITIVNDADPELERRHLKTWRSSLLAARARAEARLGHHDTADRTLLAAMRTCPRGAVDPMISLEVATGTCLALRGDTLQAHRHFDRALRASDAIGHHFHAWVVNRERESLHTLRPRTPPPVHERRRQADTEDVALLLADVSSLLNTGHSLDLLAQRVISILEASPLRTRLRITRAPATGDHTAPTAAWQFRGSHGCRIDLSDSDTTISIDIRALASLEEIALVKSLTDVIGVAVHLDEDADTHLWPRTEPPDTDTAVFWSPRMQELLRIAQRLASTTLPILITGETGTGKEVFARIIHEHSRVRRGPFIPFNASAIPRDLVESQMFGHRRGSFTGALESSPGVIRSADQGTLFLDEIGDLDPTVQPKLLRFLESGEIHPVGDLKPSHVAVRVVAATNAGLDDLVAQGRFRADLLYRLRVAALNLPPLRERKDEIPALTAHFVRKAVAESQRSSITVGDDVVAALLLHDWPGNLRELSNELRRVVALAEEGATLRATDLSPDVAAPWFAARPQAPAPVTDGVTVRLNQPLDVATEELERAFIEHALTQTHGRVSDAAHLLGISRKGFFIKRKKLGLE